MSKRKVFFKNNIDNEFFDLSNSPYYIENIEGVDGLSNIFSKTKGMFQDGNIISSKTIDSREIVITGIIKGTTTEEIQLRRKKLIKLFNLKSKGFLKYNYGGSTKQIEVEISKAHIFTKRISSKLQTYIVNLDAPNPFWQDISENKANVALWKGTFKFPLKIKQPGILMGYKEPSLIVNVLNNGDVPCGMIIEFRARGTLKNPYLFNVNTREYIKVNRTMTAGEKIIINTSYGKKRIESEVNGIKTNILNYFDLTSTFLQLDVGDNLFRYDAEENLSNLEVNIYYNQQYLGV